MFLNVLKSTDNPTKQNMECSFDFAHDGHKFIHMWSNIDLHTEIIEMSVLQTESYFVLSDFKTGLY